jgi:hypothetical protein
MEIGQIHAARPIEALELALVMLVLPEGRAGQESEAAGERGCR